MSRFSIVDPSVVVSTQAVDVTYGAEAASVACSAHSCWEVGGAPYGAMCIRSGRKISPMPRVQGTQSTPVAFGFLS